jgi:hypothetical protein
MSSIGIVGVVLVTYFAIHPAAGQIKQGKTRPLKTSQLMGGLVGPNCGALKKGLDAGPADEKAWKSVATNAALLNEASHIVMADGRCPDGTWKDAAMTLRECSAAVLKAIDEQDVDAAKSAFGAMTKACGTCHKAHKK